MTLDRDQEAEKLVEEAKAEEAKATYPTCPSCHLEIQPDAPRCPHCGRSLV
jgi:predicted RNA-binding Zn-ribbon protein involved in translation (DUF1610 family)